MSFANIRTWLKREPHLVYEGDSSHHHITIVEESGCRTMYLGPAGEEAETSINLANPEAAVFEYPGLMLAGLPLAPRARRLVMVGLGGGFIPRLFQKYLPDYELTVVEIDLMVAELAATYFDFHPGGNVKLVVADGRAHIAGLPAGGVDQIWLDAFGGDYTPGHLLTREFLEICRNRLAPGGLLVQNLHQSRPHLFERQLRTAALVFGPPLALSGRRCGNVVTINSKEPASWTAAALRKAAKDFGARLGPYDLAAELGKAAYFSPNPQVPILTDPPAFEP